MIPAIRQYYNTTYNTSQYTSLVESIKKRYPDKLDFRIAETPLFIPKAFERQMIETCNYILSVIQDTSFISKTEQAIPPAFRIEGNEGKPQFMVFDFGICKNETGNYEPQLIEMQGFPSLFAYQVILDEALRDYLPIPSSMTTYLNGKTKGTYVELLKEIVLGNHQKEEVILLELFPDKQKTRIDFSCTENLLGIKTVCLTKIIRKENKLFYTHEGQLKPIKRIYNRLIFDELQYQTKTVQSSLSALQKGIEVEWCNHPHWYYRISKFTLPFLHHPNIPSSYFLHEVKQLPANLDQYVLKPLFSFAGQGVEIDLNEDMLQKIKDPENWLLQEKVAYADCIETPDGPAKGEVRLFYWWPADAPSPIPVNNLGRISKGKMMGTLYNKDKNWVGATCCYFER
jgi:hypothetical protein